MGNAATGRGRGAKRFARDHSRARNEQRIMNPKLESAYKHFRSRMRLGRGSMPFALAAQPPPPRRGPKDITERSSSMPRDSAILYPVTEPRTDDDPCHYRGIMRDADGRTYWCGLWVRLCNGRKVLEIRRVPKK